MDTSGRSNTGPALWVAAALVSVAVVSRTWVEVVSHYVPEPYLDEVFHVPQAQKYCQGRYTEWDDKITTPPGLYLLSLLIPKNLAGRSLSEIFSCDTTSLRGVNALALTALANLALLSRWQIEARLHGARHPTKLKAPSRYAIHSAVNIALFPVIFFFSGLYYTDVASTAVVLGAFLNTLRRMGRDRSSLLSDMLTIFLGILALLMRQTNVFWVVVFLGGLEAIHAVKTLRPQQVDEPAINTVWGRIKFFSWRYSLGEVHDLPLHAAWEDDVFFTAVSFVVAAVCNPLRILRQVWPHITVLVAFASFIIWNGGVVLGDKSNHVATIHLAQMLYIWPFFAFFSIPLLLPYVTSFIFMVLSGSRSEPSKSLPASASSNKDAADSAATGLQISLSSKRRGSRKHNNDAQDRTAHDSARPDHRYSPLLRSLLVLCQTKSTIWLIYILATILVSVAIVKFNTIIHPFTLADNRHYMFYVFRYTIRRSSWIRYALVMIYSVSRWMVWGTLRGCSTWLFEITGDDCSTNFSYSPLPPNSYASHPFTYNAGRPQSKAPFAGSTVAAESEEIRKEKQEQVDRALREDPLLYSTEPVSTSAALVFLLATSLSLITAPLVEPRYFIIPWVIWRLLIPSWRVHDHRPGSEIEKIQGSGTLLGKLLSFFKHYDSRLILETVWFVAINIGTMCIFLFKPYQWRAEDGTLLDNGRWQRFMW